MLTDYEKGFRYGRQVAGRMTTAERRRSNDRHVRDSEYVQKGSPTRAYWLGFRRAIRSDR